ncbi:MAG: PhoX family protein [Acidobacteriota bacterium]|jgi:secreted PhoX family phosphatase|nr:PhoX family protein [Acidobacteriota bacterium]
MNRRNFLINAAMASGGAALMFGGFLRRADIFAQTGNFEALRAIGYGELAPTAAKNTGEMLLALPKGFEYKVFGKAGGIMTDGQKTPRAHDAMATFQVNGDLRIVRNHEIYNRIPSDGAAIGTGNHYDQTAGGGTTTLIINRKSREIVRDFVSLSGTLNNCAGGTTPWGSWISCEEITFGQTKYTAKDGKEVGGYVKAHGYCFEVSAAANENLPTVPLKAMGRFVHEAVAVDRKTGIVYETEDNNPAGFYRFVPNRKKQLAEGGTLQVLAVKNQPNYDTRTKQKIGAVLATNWLEIKNPDPIEADTDSLAMFKPAMKNGAALFNRLEGCIPAKNEQIYFASTSGGDSRCGQIWLYEPAGRDAGNLTLVFESPDQRVLDMPDNICLSPKNNLLFMCEDSDYKFAGASSPENFIRILTPEGKVADFAKNITPGKEASEFAGATFSKDGKTLFVNIQTAGVTVAIWGDWKNFKD